jgi:hypothetical protein
VPEIGGAVRNATAQFGPWLDDDDADSSPRPPLKVYCGNGSGSTSAHNANDLRPSGHPSMLFLLNR